MGRNAPHLVVMGSYLPPVYSQDISKAPGELQQTFGGGSMVFDKNTE